MAALVLSVAAWAAGCATSPRPAIEPAFAARTYTPIRVALLPPDVFLVLDQVGDNDPVRSEALRQKVFSELVPLCRAAMQQRGYDLDLSARWDGVWDRDGNLQVGRDELAAMANAILQFVNGPSGAATGPIALPQIIAPELAAKIGWATQSDSLLYVNLKGVTTSNGKRTAEVVGAVLFVLVLAVIVLSLLADHGGGGGRSGGPGKGLAGGSRPTVVAPAVRGVGAGGGRAAAAAVPVGTASGAVRSAAPVGRGAAAFASPGGPRRVYGGGGGPNIGIGVGVVVPLDGPVYTHEGSVEHEDEWFAGDELYVSFTLVNAADGRVLWHLREALDLDAEDPEDVRALVNRVVGSMPMRGDLSAAPSPH